MTIIDTRPNPDAYREPDFETWSNTTLGTIVLKVRGEYGVEREQRIEGKKTFQITPRDRRLNQERTANVKFDVFTNGTLAVVSLVDGEADNASLESNPNVVSDQEIVRILRMKPAQFSDRLDTITNALVFERMLELAETNDISVARYKAVQNRLTGTREVRTVQTKKFAPGDGDPIPVNN